MQVSFLPLSMPPKITALRESRHTIRCRAFTWVLPFGLLLTASSLPAQVSSPGASDAGERGVTAVSNDTFLSSLGVNTHVSQGYNPGTYVLPLRYLGVRNIRDSERNPRGLLLLKEQAGVRVDLQGQDVKGLVSVAKTLSKAGALMAIEGPNEPNNFLLTYKGKEGGGTSGSWVPVAEVQRDLYQSVKGDPELKDYPVFHVSEGGAETENVGLQFLTIPPGANALLPDGTRFADYANPHNYVTGNHIGYISNQAWQAADPTLGRPLWRIWKNLEAPFPGLFQCRVGNAATRYD
jgi:hypothetical protein